MATSTFIAQPGTLSLVDQLLTMARTVLQTAYSAMDCLACLGEPAWSTIFQNESRINSLEMFIDERIERTLSSRKLNRREIRMALACQRINKDLERIGDLSVNIVERLQSLAEYGSAPVPAEVLSMTKPVKEMLAESILSLQTRNFAMANDVLNKDHTVDGYRDLLYKLLAGKMIHSRDYLRQHVHLLLISRHLEKIADHSTNIAEAVIYWLRAVDVRHGHTITAVRKSRT